MADRMFNIQRTATNNVTDLQDFLKDLNDWEGDIKKKDDRLKSKPQEMLDKPLPPVRGSGKKIKDLTKSKEVKSVKFDTKGVSNGVGSDQPADEIPAKKQKPLPRDFRAWDKINVDAMLDEIDAEDAKPASLESSETSSSEEEEMTAAKWKQKANFEKERGNDLFKKGEYDAAIERYTRGLNADPANAVLLANRAMALLKVEKFGAAEVDCTAALDLDAAYVKALLRRGVARTALGKLEDAKMDYEDVLFLEANNKQAKQELGKVKRMIDKRGFQKENEKVEHGKEVQAGGQVTKETNKEGVNSRMVLPIEKPLEKRSKNPLRSIRIVEVGLSKEESEKKRAIEEGSLKRLNQMSEEDLKFFQGTSLIEDDGIELVPTTSTNPAKIEVIGKKQASSEKMPGLKDERSTKREGKEKIKVVTSQSIMGRDPIVEDNPLQSIRMGSKKEDDYWQKVADDLDPARSDKRSVGKSFRDNRSKLKSGSEANNVSPVVPNSTEQTAASLSLISQIDVPPVPNTALQLQTDLRNLLKSSPSSALTYVSKIPPDSLPAIVKNMLDTDLVMDVIKTFAENGDHCVVGVGPYLKALSRTNRFDMAAMFMTNEDKKTLRALLNKQQEAGLLPTDTFNDVSNKFGLL